MKTRIKLVPNIWEDNLDGTTTLTITRRSGETVSTIVDTEDVKELSKNRWGVHALDNSTKGSVRIGRSTKDRKAILIYNEIMDNFDTGLVCDHLDRDCLNNTKKNLQIVTQQENSFNAEVKGWYATTDSAKFQSMIKVNGKNKHIGVFLTKEEATKAYRETKKKLHRITGCEYDVETGMYYKI